MRGQREQTDVVRKRARRIRKKERDKDCRAYVCMLQEMNVHNKKRVCAAERDKNYAERTGKMKNSKVG